MTIQSISDIISIRDRVEFDYNGQRRIGKVESINEGRGTFTVDQGEGNYKQYAIAKIGRLYVENAICRKVIVLS